MKYRKNASEPWKELYIKALDSMPVGSIVDYDGQVSDIPVGWEQVSDNIVVLYDNSTGTTGNVSLSDSISNYRLLEIHYFNKDWQKYFVFITSTEYSTVSMGGQYVDSNGADVYTAVLTLSSNTITRNDTYFSSKGGNPFAYNPFKINKVIGYK